jgi:hypothetical protein
MLPWIGQLAQPLEVLLNENTQEKRPLKSGPKFREETPKKGSNTATPIAVLYCKI